jgi:peptidoglycan/xylan/chitin deacetylase (PgdA/CDA1 family)
VLLYHRVATLEADPQRLAVSPERFADQLQVLRARCRPMPLLELNDRLQARTLPARAVAVTFDDGYADNLECGKPLLERAGVPATVFLTSSYLGGARELWWDELERILLRPGWLPRTLRLRVGDGGEMMREWDLGDSDTYAAEHAVRHADWHVERADDPTPRHRVYRSLCGLLRRMSAAHRDGVLVDLASVAVLPDAGPRVSHRVLTRGEVVTLVDNGTVQAGAHTEGHPVLAALPVADQRLEIAGCKAALQSIVGREVTSFAYPFGSRADYSRATRALVREAGFEVACTARPGAIARWSDRLQLPRMIVRDWDAQTFASHLDAWLAR